MILLLAVPWNLHMTQLLRKRKFATSFEKEFALDKTSALSSNYFFGYENFEFLLSISK